MGLVQIVVCAALIGLWLPPARAATSSAPQAAKSAAASTIIRSRAELNQYLKRTPRDAPPLGWLSSGGRKRFLAQLVFTPRGLGGFSTADLQHELTHAQIVKVLRLFDLAAYADGMSGLAPAEQAKHQSERRAAARARGCKRVATCPASDIEQRLDRLVLHQRDASLSAAQRSARVVHRYDHLFGALQTPSALAAASPPDLRLLTRAAQQAVFWAPNARHIAQLQRDLAEMQRRGMSDAKDFAPLYRALIASRQFNHALSLAREHSKMDITPFPAWQPPTKLAAGQPTALTLAADGKTMTRQAVDLGAPLRIVVVASCHFSKDAARAIKAVPRLRKLFAEHATWLADQSDSIAAAVAWNHEFPEQPIHIAWHNHEWSMLNSWAMPTFYVFRHGKLVDQWAGWPADSGMQTLRRHLDNDGVL